MRLTIDSAVATNTRIIDTLDKGRPVLIHAHTQSHRAIAQAIRCHAHVHGSGLAAVLATELVAAMFEPGPHEGTAADHQEP